MELLKKIKEDLEEAQNPLIVILGPTASGKTALSIKIAQLIGGEIISTDSRQIYKEMEIGTDAVSTDEQQGIPHHMLGITTPDKTLSLAEYHDLAIKKIEEIKERGHVPILAGGTGLYIESIIQGYDIPRVPPNPELRAKLEKLVEENGKNYLYQELKKIDPKAAKKIHPNNVRYIIRAIERAEGKEVLRPENPPSHNFDVLMIGIQWPREELYANIEKRVDRQVERGLLNEVQQLLNKGYSENLPSMSSLGVKEMIPHIRGEQTLEEALNILKKNTRNYAKRQMTWFRRYDNVLWLKPKDVQEFTRPA